MNRITHYLEEPSERSPLGDYYVVGGEFGHVCITSATARRIQAALDKINVNASKILWGVRAIERETTPLKAGLPELRATLVDVVGGTGLIAETLTQADQHVGAAAEALAGPRPASVPQT